MRMKTTVTLEIDVHENMVDMFNNSSPDYMDSMSELVTDELINKIRNYIPDAKNLVITGNTEFIK